MLCSISGCNKERKQYSAYCACHRSRMHRYGTAELPSAMSKRCLICGNNFSMKPASHNRAYCSGCRPEAKKNYPSYKQWEKSEGGKAYFASYHVVYKERLKELVYDHYGWLCNCCGEDTVEFLSIDHVFNNGNEDRKRNIRGTSLLKKIIEAEYPDSYQILCMNCNFGKKITGGICPHQL